MNNGFSLISSYEPAGDQPEAIANIIKNYANGATKQTLRGATGTGKTFTMANIINDYQKPTLILSHNKTLAAQLATEFKYFFPKNAVHYFISYFDYYQPESYLPQQDIYIEKEATINQEIQMYRLATMASLASRKDVIVVASVSALYGLGEKEVFSQMSTTLIKGQEHDRTELKKKLITMQYKAVQSKIEPGMFETKGELFDIYSSVENVLYRLHFNDDLLEIIEKKDALSFASMGTVDQVTIRPATQFIQNNDNIEEILQKIQTEMDIRKDEFTKAGKLVEAQRIQKRTDYDIRMIRETGFVNGIENYSPYFDDRRPGQTPISIFDYFPEDMLLIVDESHMTLPQLQAMPRADRARKINLINHGFRLPSAIDHRPLRFDELCTIVGRQYNASKHFDKYGHEGTNSSTDIASEADKQRGDAITNDFFDSLPKKGCKSLFVSATPAPYEIKISDNAIDQIIRPTGLLDPITYVYPKSGRYDTLISSYATTIDKIDQKIKDKENIDHEQLLLDDLDTIDNTIDNKKKTKKNK